MYDGCRSLCIVALVLVGWCLLRAVIVCFFQVVSVILVFAVRCYL